MGELSKENAASPDLSKVELSAKGGDLRNKLKGKKVPSEQKDSELQANPDSDIPNTDNSDTNYENIPGENQSAKGMDEGPLKGKVPKVVLSEQNDRNADPRNLKNLISPQADFSNPQYRKQFLDNELSLREPIKPKDALTRLNTQTPDISLRPHVSLQNQVLQHSVIQSLRDKFSSIFNPNKDVENNIQVLRRGEVERDNPKAWELRNSTKNPEVSLNKEGFGTPEVQAWQREKNVKDDNRTIEAKKTFSVDENITKEIKPGSPYSLPQKVLDAFKSFWTFEEKTTGTFERKASESRQNITEAIQQKPLKEQIIKISVTHPDIEKKPDLPKIEAASKVTTQSISEKLQESMAASFKARLDNSFSIDTPKIKAVVAESREFKRFVEHVQKIDPKPSASTKEQMQRAAQETLRIAGSGMPALINIEQIKTLVTETFTKLGGLYGVPAAKPSTDFKGPVPDNTKRPPAPPAAGTETQVFRPSPAPIHSSAPVYPVTGNAPTPAEFLRGPNSKEEPLYETKKKPENEEKDPDNDEGGSQMEGLIPEFEKKTKEEKYLTIQRTYTISGKVMEASDQQGISGVFINGGSLGTAVTNFDGEFRFYNVPEGKIYTLKFLKRGYKFAPASVTDTLDGPHRHYVYGSVE